MISTFYYTSISLRDKKRKKEMRRWNRSEVVHRKERKEKRDWGERNRRQLLELWPLLHSYRAESVWCTCKVSGESAGEEQKRGGIEVRWPSCTCPASLPSVKILLETLYFLMIIMSEVYIILLILFNYICSLKRIQYISNAFSEILLLCESFLVNEFSIIENFVYWWFLAREIGSLTLIIFSDFIFPRWSPYFSLKYPFPFFTPFWHVWLLGHFKWRQCCESEKPRYFCTCDQQCLRQ